MQPPELPEDESARLQALYDSGQLFSAAEPRFDRITRLAQSLYDVDIALISLVADDFQWFKSRQGLEATQTPRSVSFCGHAILQDHILVVENALEDERFADNPLVTGDPNIRFYAGAPLLVDQQHKVGTLCLIHSEPGSLSEERQQLLRDLADMVELELRQVHMQGQLARAELAEQRLASVIAGTNIGTWEWNVQTGETVFNERWADIVGYTLEELAPISIDTWMSLAHPDDLETSNKALQAHFKGEAEFYDVVCRMRHKSGHWVWVQARGRMVSHSEDGQPLLMAGTHADVSEQIHAQQALRDNEQQYRSLVENIPGTTYRCQHDAEWTMLYMSSQVDPLSGYPSSDFIENQVRSYQSIIHPDDQARLEEEVATAVECGEPWQLEYRLLHRDGSVRWAQERGSPVYDDDGRLAYLDGFILDITSEKRLQYEQQRQLQGFAILNQIAAQASLDITQQVETALRLSAEFLALDTAVLSRIEESDYLVRACISPADSGLVAGETLPLSQTCCALTVASNDLVTLQGHNNLHNQTDSLRQAFKAYIGVPLWVNDRLYGTVMFASKQSREAFTDSEKFFMRLLGGWAATSIERHHSMRAMRKSEARLRGLFELSPYGIALNDFETGAFVDMNPALLAPSGYTKDEFSALSYWQITPEEYAIQEEEQLRSMQETGRYGPFEKEYIRKDGSRYPVLLNGMVVEDINGRKLIWSIIEDISERKRIERMKNEFISTVSHELRTPLTAIRGALSMLASGALGILPDAAEEMVVVADKNSQRLMLLINDLLDMEKLLAGKIIFDLQWQPLQPLIDSSVNENQPYASQYQVTLRSKDNVGALEVKVDASRLKQVMANLLSNAIKFSPAGADVLVSLAPIAAGVRIMVSDHGPGIADEFRERIFQKFSQADATDARQTGGTGLGLAITRELVEKMNGNVGFTSEAGLGSQFFVDLPARTLADPGN